LNKGIGRRGKELTPDQENCMTQAPVFQVFERTKLEYLCKNIRKKDLD
jgi:hypothetical protein